MAQSEYLCLKRALRAKPPEQHPPDQVEQVPHRAFIARFGPSRQADGIYDSDRARYIAQRAALVRSSSPLSRARSVAMSATSLALPPTSRIVATTSRHHHVSSHGRRTT